MATQTIGRQLAGLIDELDGARHPAPRVLRRRSTRHRRARVAQQPRFAGNRGGEAGVLLLRVRIIAAMRTDVPPAPPTEPFEPVGPATMVSAVEGAARNAIDR